MRVLKDGKTGWQVVQLPQVEGALVAIARRMARSARSSAASTSTRASSTVTQAWRQPEASFKPFIYSASLDKTGPATMISDAPLYFPPSVPGGTAWEPKDDDQPDGPMTMRTGLQRSKNLVSIRILASIGTQYLQYVTQRFGFDPAKRRLADGARRGPRDAAAARDRLCGVRERRLPIRT